MIKDRVGQMFMIGFDGCKVSKYLMNIIQHYQIGGVILFSRNINDPIQLANLCNDLQSLSPDTPLFLSIDQEGGRVSRLKEPFTQFPPAGILGEIFEKELEEIKKEGKGCTEFSYEKYKAVELVFNLGGILARELRSVGINMDLAPVLDVNTNPDNPVIGDRSFSANPYVVSTLGNAFIKGLQENGVIATGKHFPGHGSSDSDSHLGMVDVTQTWEDRELTPYRDLITDGKVDMIMSAHVYQRHLDEDYPATLSKKILGDLLRGEMDYGGVIISDDMNMGAIKDHYGFDQAIELALNAGVDILLFGNNLHYDKDTAAKVSNLIIRLVNTGKVSNKQINESVHRILSLKRKSGLL